MSAPVSYPAPRSNLTAAGFRSRASGIVAADVLVATGDFTGGASEDLFTLSSHGLSSGDVVHVLWQSLIGGVTGGVGLRAIAKVASSSTFQLTSDGTTVIENTADATVAFLKGRIPTEVAVNLILPNLIVGSNDTTGGTVEDMFSAATGLQGALDGDTLKLLYKSAAGAAAVAVDATVYVKTPVVSATAEYCQTSLTSGGAVADTTADGTVIFLLTS